MLCRFVGPQIVAVVPTIKLAAIPAPLLTCSAPVFAVDDVTTAVPCTTAPARTTKSLIYEVFAIYFSPNFVLYY